MEENKKKQKRIVIAFITIFLLIVLGIAFFSNKKNGLSIELKKENHLISGVPYYTLYNTFMDMEANYISSAKDVYEYWGYNSEDVSLASLKNRYGNNGLKVDALLGDFKAKGFNGIVFYPKRSSDGAEELNFIKNYVSKDIPIFALQQRTTNPADVSNGYRVVIGYSDDTQKVTVHDYGFGNNYQIAYSDFQKMFSIGKSAAIIAVWPSDKIKNNLKPARLNSYGSRDDDIMNKVGNLWVMRSNAIEYGKTDMQKSVDVLRIMEANKDFNLLPPAYKIGVYDCMVRRILAVKKPQEAADVIVQKIQPLNHSLADEFSIFTGQRSVFSRLKYNTRGIFADSYFWLGLAYDLTGNQIAASKAFKDGVALEYDYMAILNRHEATKESVLKSMRSTGIIK
jgi:hypothetical protein